ncbi:MAG: hypothetical protein J0L71_19595, partial [Candidatus Accumulibacter sp.]|uniref:hypothetical protein n=1 Tax=Accumulibacter sp. TaxID=2053492 RepID=UPI001ACB7E44
PAVEKNEEKTSKRPENRQIPAFFMPKSKICRFPGLQVRQAARSRSPSSFCVCADAFLCKFPRP